MAEGLEANNVSFNPIMDLSQLRLGQEVRVLQTQRFFDPTAGTESTPTVYDDFTAEIAEQPHLDQSTISLRTFGSGIIRIINAGDATYRSQKELDEVGKYITPKLYPLKIITTSLFTI